MSSPIVQSKSTSPKLPDKSYLLKVSEASKDAHKIAELRKIKRGISDLQGRFDELRVEKESFINLFKDKFLQHIKTSNVAETIIYVLVLEKPENAFKFYFKNLDSIEVIYKKQSIKWLLSQKDLKDKLKRKCKNLIIANKFLSSHGRINNISHLVFLDSLFPGIKDMFLKDFFPEQDPERELEVLQKLQKIKIDYLKTLESIRKGEVCLRNAPILPIDHKNKKFP